MNSKKLEAYYQTLLPNEVLHKEKGTQDLLDIFTRIEMKLDVLLKLYKHKQ